MSNPPTATSRRAGRLRRVLFAALACVALYGAAGFLAVPPLLRPFIEKRAAAFLGRPVSLARLRLNPFALSVTADGLEIRDRDGAPLLRWDRLYLNFEAAASLFRRAWVFHQIHLSGAGVRLAMAPDGTLNIEDILAAGGGATPGAPPAKPPVLRVHRLLVEDTTLSFVDRSPGETFTTTLGPLRLDLSDFTTRSDENNAYTFRGRTEAGESFSWKGRFALGPPRSEGELTLEAVTLGKYHPYYRGTVPFDIRRGTADVRAGYRVAWGPTVRELRLLDAAVTLHDVQLSEHGKEEIAVEAPVLELEKGNLDLLRGTVAIGRIATRGGHILLRQRSDGHVNLLDMLLPFFAEPASGPPSPQAAAAPQAAAPPSVVPPAPTVALAEVTFADFTMDAEDLTPPRPVRLHLDQINLKLLGVDNVAGTTEKASLDLRWNGAGTVHADGDLSLVGLVGDLNVTIDAIDVAPLDPYIEPSLDLRITSGSFSASGRSHADLIDPKRIEFSFQGDTRMDDFSAADGARRGELVRWKSVRMAKVDYSLLRDRLRIGDLAIAAPDLALSRAADGWINLLAALHMPQLAAVVEDGAGPGSAETPAAPAPVPSASAAPAPSPEDSGDTRVAHARLSGGRIRVRDDTTVPPVVVALTHIDGTLAGLSSRPGARADVHIKALFDDTAPVSLDGQVDPLGADVFTDLALLAHGIDLGPLGPYSGRYLGYAFDRGRLDLEMHYRLESRALNGANLFTAKPFLLGDKVESPDATHLPVRLGLALLRDRNGEIRLDVPVEGSLDDPSFRLGRVVLHAIAVVFTKLVTSPFTLLARAFAGRDLDLSVVEFPPGTASLTDEARSRLDALEKGMTERPGLTLSMNGGADPNLDPDALRRGRVESLIRTEKWRTLRKSERETTPAESVAVTPDERPRFVKAAWKALRQSQPPERTAPEPKPETPEEMEAWMLVRTTIGPADLAALAGERARAVRDRLASAGIDASRLFLKEDAANPSTRVTLELQ